MKLIAMFMFFASIIPLWFDGPEGEQISTSDLYYDEFIDESKSEYDYYYELNKEKSDTFVYSVVIGKYKDNLYYDILFYDADYNYLLRVKEGDQEYSVEKIETDDGFYYSVHGIKNNTNVDTEVYLTTGLSITKSVSIPKNYDSYNALEGYSKGVVVSFLDPITGANKTLITIITVSIAIICICLIGLGVLFIIKLGKKNAKAMSYEKKEVIYKPSITPEPSKIEVEVITDDEPIKQEKYTEVTRSDSGIQNNIEQNPSETSSYQDRYEEESPKEFDLESYLLLKGFHTDYSVMTESEKNEVMVYLMILKNTNQISSEQYQKETIKLWKK